MANRYWVGGTASWNGTALLKWSATSGGVGGQTEPTASDNVFFDANSGASTVTIATTDALALSIDFTGFTGTLAGAVSIEISGNLTLGSGMNWTNTGAILFTGGAGTNTITSNGKSITSSIQFLTAGRTWNLADALSTTTDLALIGGTFNANNFNVTCRTFYTENGAVRALTMGSGTFNITGKDGDNVSGGAGAWSITGTTGLTLTANTSTIKLTDSSATTKTFIGAGLTYANYWNATGSTGICAMTGSNTFTDFKIDAGRTQKQTASTTTTITSMTAVGTLGNEITLTSITSATHTFSDTSGANNCEYMIISYSIAGGGATFTAISSTNGGNNTGWVFSTASTLTATQQSYALTFRDALFHFALSLKATKQDYTLSGQTVALKIGKMMRATLANFTLTFQSARLLFNGLIIRYTNIAKNSATFINGTKHSSTFTNQAKSL